MRVLILGAGFLGSEILGLTTSDKIQVIGARRNPPPGDKRYISLDVLMPESLYAIPESIDYLVYAVSSSNAGREGYLDAYVKGVKNVCSHFKKNPRKNWPGKVVFVSSTGVFKENAGAEVSEISELAEKGNFRTDTLIEGERIVREAFPDSRHVIARLSGIYGPGRNYMIDQARVMSGVAVNDSYTNRIHKTDGARAILHLLQEEANFGTFIVSDKEPVLRSKVLSYLREVHLGLSAIPGTGDEGNSGHLQNYTGKRCSSHKLQKTGFEFRYPTFREGYQSYFSGEGDKCQ